MTGATPARIRLPFPHPGQQAVRRQAKRFNWLSAGRRWRKTTMAMAIAVEEAAKGRRVVWGAPTYHQVRIGFDETQRAAGAVANFNQSRMDATFPTGGRISYRSLDDPDNARGETADGVIIDETADVAPAAWYEVLRPMLIDTDGFLWAIGTPRGRNWFYQEHMTALERNDTAAWQVPTVGAEVVDGQLVYKQHPLENPDVPFSEIESLWRTMPERTFKQEIMAEFIEQGGEVFRYVERAATASEQDAPLPGHQYVFGIDFGRLEDFTVVTVMDATEQSIVYVDRYNTIDWSMQVDRIVALYERFQPTVLMAERNSMGDPIINTLYERSLPIQPFITTNATKQTIIDGLALAFEQSQIRIVKHPVLMNELQSYTAEQLPSGLVKYGAPSGLHDDCVMSLALAWYGGATGGMEFGAA